MSLKEDLTKLYWEDRLTQKEIGKIYNKSQNWVHEHMKKLGIFTRNTVDIKTRFLYCVKLPENVNDCWEWVGGKHREGYGQFNSNEKKMPAHRVSYILHIGEIDPTLFCLHKCDNPSCVNPDHLFIGSDEDNVKDRVRKGRSAKGESNGNSKLTEEEVKEIKILLLQGLSQMEIGIIFKVSQQTISNIKRGYLWKYKTPCL